MVRTVTGVALVGLLLLGVTSLGAATGFESPQQVNATGNESATITVSGDGEAAAQPDQALVFVSVTATGEDSETAAARLANNTTRLRDALDGREPITSVRTTGYQLYRTPENGMETYTARQSFELRLDDTDAAGEVVDAAVAAGATEVDGVTFTLSRERRQEVRATAIDQAVDDARSRAEATASSTGLAVGDVRSVSTGGDGFSPITAEAADRGGGTVIDSGPVTVSATVRIVYDAAPE